MATAGKWGQVLQCNIMKDSLTLTLRFFVKGRLGLAAEWGRNVRKRGAMARPLRIEYPGAVYHVMAREDGRGTIFRDDADRELSLAQVGPSAPPPGPKSPANI